MHTLGSQDIFAFVAFVALLAGLWAIFRLQQRRRAQALAALDRTEATPKAAEALEQGAKRQAVAPAPPAAAAAGPQAAVAPVPAAAQVRPKAGPDLLLRSGLAASRASLWGRMAEVLGQAPKVDGAVIEALEEVLLMADVGVSMTMRLMDTLQAEAKKSPLTAEAVRALLKSQVLQVLQQVKAKNDIMTPSGKKPRVILFVGVNGVGKTTTIGKVAHALAEAGQAVVLAAGDTFRAAAAEQLVVWGERTGARVVRGEAKADPTSVMFNAMQSAQAQGADVLLADTAGRLHTNINLMDEIKKVRRALGKLRADAPDEVWLVVDATTGQNALHQAKQFHEAVGLTGLILTKLDGTAKGGIVVAIAEALKVPVYFVGVGEQAAHLRPFDAEAFVEALL